jgi:type I restriction enzyme S subunit
MVAKDTSAHTSECCPLDWQEVSLGSVADVRFSSVDKLTYPSEEPVHLCNYIDAYKNDYITRDIDFMQASATQPEIDRFGLQVGDVLITKDSETPDDIGIPAVVDYAAPDLVCGYHLGLIRPRKDEVDPTFLAKQLGHHRIARYFGRQANGLTRYGLPIGAVTGTSLWLPRDPQEQESIGMLLRLVDEAIAKTEAVIAKLKQVRTGLLHDLLTRGLNEHGQLRDPIAHPEQFKDSPLGLIPREWSCKSLKDAADWYSGATPDRSRGVWWIGDIPLLTPKDMKAFELADTSEHITSEATISGSRLMPEETVFIVVRGMILAHTFPVSLSTRSFAFNQDIKAIRGRDSLDNRFLAHWFAGNASLFLRKTTEATHGTKKLDMSELHKVVIAAPSPPEQKAIVKHIEGLDKHLSGMVNELHKVAALKSGLMSDLLTGKVRV